MTLRKWAAPAKFLFKIRSRWIVKRQISQRSEI